MTVVESQPPVSSVNGHPFVRDELLESVYGELRQIARSFLRHESVAHTLAPTALVHEAYIRLTEQDNVLWRGREHFVAMAATMMRRVLVNHAVGKKRDKRGGGFQRLPFDQVDRLAWFETADVVVLDQALTRLGLEYPEESKIVELKFFGGLSISEMAQLLEISESSVERGWRFARAWLLRELNG